MPQIYNLGGMPIQRIKELRINSLRSVDGLTPYVAVEVDPDDNQLMVILYNIKNIVAANIAADGTRLADIDIDAEDIKFTI
jgi:hypothetical protein